MLSPWTPPAAHLAVLQIILPSDHPTLTSYLSHLAEWWKPDPSSSQSTPGKAPGACPSSQIWRTAPPAGPLTPVSSGSSHTGPTQRERGSTVKLVMFCSAHLLTVALCRVESISDDTRMWPSVSSCSLDVLAGNYNYSIQQLSSSSIYKWVPLNLHILKVVNCCEMICSILMCHFSSATVQPTYSFTVPLMLSLWGTGNKYTTRRGGCAHFQMM